jgi:iron-sulfur cluster assembly protein
MLTLTPDAAAAVNALLEDPELPRSSGVRIQPGEDPQGQPALGIAIVQEPGADDEHIPAGTDHDVFLAQEVVDLLDDQVLDAEIQDQSVSFTFRPQSSFDGRGPTPNGNSPGA